MQIVLLTLTARRSNLGIDMKRKDIYNDLKLYKKNFAFVSTNCQRIKGWIPCELHIITVITV